MEPEYLWEENGNHHMAWICFREQQKIHMPFLIALLVDFPLGTLKIHLKLIGLGLAKHFLVYPL